MDKLNHFFPYLSFCTGVMIREVKWVFKSPNMKVKRQMNCCFPFTAVHIKEINFKCA